MSNKEQIRLMDQKKSFSTLVIRRLVYSINSEVVEYVKGVYHGDRYCYNCRLTRL